MVHKLLFFVSHWRRCFVLGFRIIVCRTVLICGVSRTRYLYVMLECRC